MDTSVRNKNIPWNETLSKPRCKMNVLSSGYLYRMIVLLALAAMAARGAFRPPAFDAARAYTVSGQPYAVALGDFNGDGRLDAAVAASSAVDILLGQPGGAFRTSAQYSVAALTTAIVVADFNGDGKLDLAVVNTPSVYDTPGTVSILLGNGDGTFKAPVTYPAGNSPFGLVAGDLTGDGKPDLVVTNGVGNGMYSVLLGNGDGSFQPPVTYNLPWLNSGNALLADFNHDKKLDLAILGNGGVCVLPGNGNGTFRSEICSLTPQIGENSLAAADLNNDGNLDLALTSFDSGVVVMLGNGDGTFQAPVQYTAGNEPVFVAIEDFNGDGKLDLAVANAGSTQDFFTLGGVSILLGNGDGTFQPATNYLAGYDPSFVAAGHLTRGGPPTVVTANLDSNNISVLSAAAGAFPLTASFAAGGFPNFVISADFNGDGQPDAAVANSQSNNISILLGAGGGAFQTAVNYQVGDSPCSIAAGDFNGDAKIDLAVVNCNDHSISILLGNGDGTFQPQRTVNEIGRAHV